MIDLKVCVHNTEKCQDGIEKKTTLNNQQNIN